jgi:hypothetical protein
LIIDIYANPITKPFQLADIIGVTIDDNKLDSQANMLKDIETMNSFGSPTTGSYGHKHFVS